MAERCTSNPAVPSRDGVNAGRGVSTGCGVASDRRMFAAVSLRLGAHGDRTVRADRDECETDNRSARQAVTIQAGTLARPVYRDVCIDSLHSRTMNSN